MYNEFDILVLSLNISFVCRSAAGMLNVNCKEINIDKKNKSKEIPSHLIKTHEAS